MPVLPPMTHTSVFRRSREELMSQFSQTIAWVGTAYGGVASVYLWAWYFSAISKSEHFSLSPLQRPTILESLLIFHFVIGLLAIVRLPKYWMPIGPPNSRFRKVLISLITLAVGGLLVF